MRQTFPQQRTRLGVALCKATDALCKATEALCKATEARCKANEALCKATEALCKAVEGILRTAGVHTNVPTPSLSVLSYAWVSCYCSTV